MNNVLIHGDFHIKNLVYDEEQGTGFVIRLTRAEFYFDYLEVRYAQNHILTICMILLVYCYFFWDIVQATYKGFNQLSLSMR